MNRPPRTQQSNQPHDGAIGGSLFLSYNSLDRGAVQAVQQHLHARGISTFLDRDQLRPGLPWFDALQEAVGNARAAAIFIGKDGLGTWQKREMELALDRQAREEKADAKFPVIPVVLQGADLEKAPGFLLLNTWVDLRGRLDNAGALDALVKAIRGEAALPPAPAAEALPPYRALRAFREEDAPLFFGREAFAAELLQKTVSHRLVAVVGPSGSGKSSVVQAGLLPLLRREHPPSAVWDVVIFTPGKRPFHNLAAALVPMWEAVSGETQRLREAEGLGGDLAGGKVALEAAVNLALKKSSGTDRLLIVIDQFEELFTLTPEAERRSFIKSLLEVIPVTPVTVLLTLRADFYGRAIELSRDLSDRMQRGQVNLGPMTREELRRAVENPARAVGLGFDSGLAGRILDHIEEQPGNLPLLEFALTELWERRQGGLLTNGKYDEIGGVEGAISKRAEEQFNRLTAEEREAALRLLSRLVRVAAATEEGTDTRQRVRLSELDESLQAVVQAFVGARLLVTSRNEATGEETVEVAHEALIRRWDRLKQLINKDREFLLWRQRLGLLLVEWQRTGQEQETLLRGAPLAEARGWLKERGKDLNEGEQEFIRGSTRQDVTTRRKRRWAATAAAVLAVLALAGVIGWRQWVRSDSYQIRTILAKAPGLVAYSVKNKVDVSEWISTLVQTGHVDEADKVFNVIREVKDPGTRFDHLVEVAEALAKAGKADEAQRAADEALATAREEEGPGTRANRLVGVAVMLANMGKADEALAIARELKDPEDRVDLLKRVAYALANVGKAGEALAIAREVKDPAERDDLLGSVVKGVADVGKADETRRAAGEALAAAREIGHPETRVHFLGEVAEALAKAGKADEAQRAAGEALATAREIDSRNPRAKPRSSLAYVLAKVGKTDEALAIAREVKDPDPNALQLPGVVAEALAKAGKADEALAIAREIEHPETRVHFLGVVAEALADVGKADEAQRAAGEALATAHKISSDDSRSTAFLEVAKAFAKLRNYYEALEVADHCSKSSEKLSAYTVILREYHKERNPELAKSLKAEE